MRKLTWLENEWIVNGLIILAAKRADEGLSTKRIKDIVDLAQEIEYENNREFNEPISTSN